MYSRKAIKGFANIEERILFAFLNFRASLWIQPIQTENVSTKNNAENGPHIKKNEARFL